MAIAANPALLAPALLGAALLAVLAAEGVGGPPKPRLDPVDRTAAVAAAGPAALHPTDIAAEAGTIMARPLFSVTRRPAHNAAGAGPATVSLRLSAILIGGADRACVFDADGHPLLAREGGHAGPYTILAIGADRVTVASPDGTRVLRPTALPAGAADASVSPATPPPVPALQNLLARLRGMRGP